MKKEQIKKEYILELETLIKEKRKKFEKLSGVEKDVAKYHYLEEFNDFVALCNRRLNEIMDKHGFIIQNDKEFEDFTSFIKPVVEKLHKKYYEGLGG